MMSEQAVAQPKLRRVEPGKYEVMMGDKIIGWVRGDKDIGWRAISSTPHHTRREAVRALVRRARS